MGNEEIAKMLKQLLADMAEVKRVPGISTEAVDKIEIPLTSFRQRVQEAEARRARNAELRKNRMEKAEKI